MAYGGLPEAGDEQTILGRIDTTERTRNQLGAGASKDLSARIGQIYRANPWMKPGEILALAKAGASDQLVNAAAAQSGRLLPQRLDPNPPQKQGWWERNVYSKLKAATRYTFAGLNLAPELAQNVASQVFSGNNPEGFDGWFKSTSLGTMLAASKGEIDPATGQRISAGEGFFIGGTAFEKQAERARRVRGTINGSAWTVGRGAASVAFAPGSKPYNALSGFVDAAVNVFADPTLYGGKALKGIRATGLKVGDKTIVAGAAIPSLQTTDEIAAFAKVAREGELAAAGLSQGETVAWNASKFRQWATTNGKAQRLIDTLVGRDDAYDIFENVFKGKIDVADAKRLAEAKSSDEVLAIIGEAANRMDSELSGIFPTDIREIVKARDRIPVFNQLRNTRLLTKIPDHFVRFGSAEDNAKAARSYGNYLKSAGIDVTQGEGKEFMREVMEVAADPTMAGTRRVDQLFETLVGKVVSDDLSKGPLALAKEDADGIAARVFATVREKADEMRAYSMDEMGNPEDFGAIAALNDAGFIQASDDVNPDQIKNLRLAGPGSLSEMADKVYVLPDIRVVRRLTSNPFMRRAASRRAGDPGAVTAMTDYLQNEIWKPLTLMTGGYIMRNMFDAQIRIAAVGLDGFFSNPFAYIMLVLNKSLPEAFLRGGDAAFEKGIKETAENMDTHVSKFREAMSFGLRRNLDDPTALYQRGIRSGSFGVAHKTRNKEQYLRGVYEDMRRLSQDQLDNAIAKGISREDLLTWIRSQTDPQAVDALDTLRRYLREGLDTIDITNGEHKLLKLVDGEVSDEVLAIWMERLGNPRINTLTGGDETLRAAMGYRRMPIGAAETINPENLRDVDFVGGTLRRGVGSEVVLGVEDGKPIYGVVTSVNSETSWTVRRLSDNDVWDTAAGKAELENYLATLYSQSGNQLPTYVKYAPIEGVPTAKGVSQKELQAISLRKRAVDGFFNFYGKASAKFERSPVFRQEYYRQFIDNADLLTKEQAALLLESIPGRAARIGKRGMDPEMLFGGKKEYRRFLDKIRTANGTGTVKQLEDYAQMRALQFTKQTLFNATERNNLEDILRVIIPFGAAWREILTSYGEFLIEDPRLVRRFQQVYTGAVNFDPDNDGQGFFYKDPITGENTFNLPFSGEFSKLVTGVNAPLQANVKGLSMGLQIIPAVGPVVQLAASEIIPDTPSTDFIVKALLPYGRKEPGSLVPGWTTKLYSALRDNPGKLESIYGNTYGETVRALSASGEYELNDPAEKERLLNEAKVPARILTAMRALSQFLGPTVGTPEAIIRTDEGDAYSSFLVKEFQTLQQENYDTAVKRFLERHGMDAILYVSSKTQSVQPGVEASEQFGDWERKNRDIMGAYKEVAAYFAPGGDDFSFEVWQRQIRSGQRKRLTADEMIDVAQYRVGSAIYRDLRVQAGKFPNQKVKDWLSRQRQKIHEQYPGFPARPVFTVGEFDKQLEKLRLAVADTRLADNAVAKTTAEYLRYRDQAVAKYVAAGGKATGFATAKSTTQLRQWLFNIGTALVEAEPDFGRIWERQLSSEVDEL